MDVGHAAAIYGDAVAKNGSKTDIHGDLLPLRSAAVQVVRPRCMWGVVCLKLVTQQHFVFGQRSWLWWRDSANGCSVASALTWVEGGVGQS